MTPRLARLPVDPERGYPVPWFVTWINGKPEFRLADSEKWVQAVKHSLCWVCGEPMGSYKAFVIGPMCCVNRISGDPPSHLECALWSVKGCPFLTKPQMVRREDELVNRHRPNVGGIMIERNPGVMLIWVTKKYTLASDGRGRHLFSLGEPDSLSWWSEGRRATREEVMRSIDTGLPLLREMCDHERTPARQQEARKELEKCVERAMVLVPA